MIDNNYRKVRGVYELTLKNEPTVHLLEDGKLTPELESAWELLGAKHAAREARLQQLRNSKRIKIMIFLGKCKRFPKKAAHAFMDKLHAWASRG